MNAFEILMKTSADAKHKGKTKNGFAIYKGSAVDDSECYLLQFDGGAVPNPGEASGGAVLFGPGGRKLLAERGEYLSHATNNQAEYTGIYIGVKYALEIGVRNIMIEGDSKLVISQLEGTFKVKNEGLKELYICVKELLDKFEFVALRHVLRDKNAHADRLTDEVIEGKASFTRKF